MIACLSALFIGCPLLSFTLIPPVTPVQSQTLVQYRINIEQYVLIPSLYSNRVNIFNEPDSACISYIEII